MIQSEGVKYKAFTLQSTFQKKKNVRESILVFCYVHEYIILLGVYDKIK